MEGGLNIPDIFEDTESFVYGDILRHKQHGEIVKYSSKLLHVYNSLKSIFHPSFREESLTIRSYYIYPSIISLENKSCIDIGVNMVMNGYHPLVMCTTKNDKPATKNMGLGLELNEETEMYLRSSIIYPLRSTKYKKFCNKFTNSKQTPIVRQCMSTFIPNVLVFKGPASDQFRTLDWKDCLYINTSVVSGPSTCEGFSDEHIKGILKGKMTCIFITALKERIKHEGMFDSVVINDMFCNTDKLREIYCLSILEILSKYMYHFRMISLSIRDDKLRYMLEKLLTPSS